MVFKLILWEHFLKKPKKRIILKRKKKNLILALKKSSITIQSKETKKNMLNRQQLKWKARFFFPPK